MIKGYTGILILRPSGRGIFLYGYVFPDMTENPPGVFEGKKMTFPGEEMRGNTG